MTDDRARTARGVALATGVISSVGFLAIVRVLVGFFQLPVTREFGWQRSTFVGVTMCSPLTAMLFIIWMGRLSDRHGSRAVVLPGLVLYGVALGLMATMTANPLWGAITSALVGIGCATQAPPPFIRTLTGWFGRNRGRIMGLSLGLGGACGTAFFPFYTGWLISHFGWRAGYLGLSAAVLVVAVPVAWFLFRDPLPTPQDRDDTAQAQPDDTATAAARRSPILWSILIAVTLHNFVIAGLSVNVVPILADRGLPPGVQALYLAVTGVALTIGRVAAGFALDRFDTPRIGLPFFVVAVVGIVIFTLAGDRVPLLLLAAVCAGFGSGAELSLEAYYVGRYFGQRAVGQLSAMIFMPTALAAALGGVALARFYDVSGGYSAGLWAGSALMVLAIGFVLFLPPYRFPAQGDTA